MSNEYFLGKGTGDLNIKAECVFVSKTYEVEDCTYYSDFNADDGNWVKVNSNPTFSNSILSLPNLSGSTQGYYILNQVLNSPYSVELGFVNSGSSFPLRVSWYDGTTKKYDGTYSKSGRNYWGVISKNSEPNPSTGDIFTLEIDETEVRSYRNNNIISTTNYSLLGYKFGFNHDSNIAQKWDYIKIKPL